MNKIEEPYELILGRKVNTLLQRLRELRINDYQHGTVMNKLNPYFGFKDGDTTNGLYSRGVQDIWMRAEVDRILVETLPNGYGSKEKKYQWRVTPFEKMHGCKNIEMTDKQREGVFAFVQYLIDERLAKIEQWKSNPDLEDALPEIEAWAKEYVKEKYPRNTIALTKGKRLCDTKSKPYYALLCNNGASVPLFQDSQRKLTCRCQAPLCGTSGEWEFTMDNYKTELASAINWCLN